MTETNRTSESGIPEILNTVAYGDNWLMGYGERIALLGVLQALQPEYAIEIGTAQGGSLAVLSRYAGQVLALESDSSCATLLEGKFPNVEFIGGMSCESLPSLLRKLERAGAALGFILVDGDHSAPGVKEDVENILQFKPAGPLIVMMHDSFNPEVRDGINQVNWTGCPYVHLFDRDFVPGVLWENLEMWGGFSLAVMLPTPRSGDLEIRASAETLFQMVHRCSVHQASRQPG